MISLFSRMMDYHVEAHFRKDPAGRLVFLPFGPRKKGYYVNSKPDEEKIKAFVKLYRSAGVLLSWMTFPGVYIPGLLITSYLNANPLKTKLEAVAGTALLLLLVFLALFWMLWGIYKRTVPALTASLGEVGPELKGQLSKISGTPQRLQPCRLALSSGHYAPHGRGSFGGIALLSREATLS